MGLYEEVCRELLRRPDAEFEELLRLANQTPDTSSSLTSRSSTQTSKISAPTAPSLGLEAAIAELDDVFAILEKPTPALPLVRSMCIYVYLFIFFNTYTELYS